MKILQINTYFHIIGGAKVYFFNLGEMFEKASHEVVYFSMRHPENFQTPHDKYFVSYFPEADRLNSLNKIKYLFRSFYSLEAKRKLNQLINDFHPCVAHIYSIAHKLTHSVKLILMRMQKF